MPFNGFNEGLQLIGSLEPEGKGLQFWFSTSF